MQIAWSLLETGYNMILAGLALSFSKEMSLMNEHFRNLKQIFPVEIAGLELTENWVAFSG